MYTDETLTCVDCGRDFQFTASEQEFFASKGFANKPSRCGDCRAARQSPQRLGLLVNPLLAKNSCSLAVN